MAQRADVAVVGAGIVGLAFAWEAARRGKSVVLFERGARATGASVRNFGMIWPIGQPAGADYARALRSRDRWLELGRRGAAWVNDCGSLHLAYEDDEDAVLREFAAEVGPAGGVSLTYLSAADAACRFPAINPGGLKGALHSPTELAVNPPEVIARIPRFLAETYGVTFRPATAVVGVEAPRVVTAAGEVWHADRVFVCSGTDFETLFPAAYAAAGVGRCKLQMMKTRPQPDGWRVGPHVAGGLTLCHYRSFAGCRTLPALRARFAATMPEYLRHGIHVMASQNDAGEVVIGDSHEYDDAISPFDRSEIDGLILSYARKFLRLPDWTIAARWHGEYARHPDRPVVYAEPQPRCVVVTAPGGAGMTLAFGFAADWWDEHDR